MEKDIRIFVVAALILACLVATSKSAHLEEVEVEVASDDQMPMQPASPTTATATAEAEKKKKDEEEKKKKMREEAEKKKHDEEEKKKHDEEEKKKHEDEEKKKKEEEEKKHTPNGLLSESQQQQQFQLQQQQLQQQQQQQMVPQPTPTPSPVFWLRRRQRPVACSMYPCDFGRSRVRSRDNDLCLSSPSYRTEYPQCESHCCSNKRVVFVVKKCSSEDRKACKGVYDFSSCTCYVHEEGYCQQFAPVYHPTRRRRMKKNMRDSDNARECKRMCEAFNEEDNVKCIAWVFTKGKGWNQKCNAWGPQETDIFGSRRANQCYMYLKNDEGEWGRAFKNPKAVNRAFQTRPHESTNTDCTNSAWFHPKFIGKFDLPVAPCEGCLSGAIYPYRYANVPLPKSNKSVCKYDSRGLIPTPSDSSWHKMCKTTSSASFDFN